MDRAEVGEREAGAQRQVEVGVGLLEGRARGRAALEAARLGGEGFEELGDRRRRALLVDEARALDEVARVLRPGGELRFYEQVLARNARLARLQRLLDKTLWPRLFTGCHTTRDTEATLIASGLTPEARERFSFRPTLLATPIAPRVLGRARRAGW